MSDERGLRRGTAVGEALRAAAGEILAEARKPLDDAAGLDAAAVHDFRRAMKRWRALLRLLAPFVGPQGRALRLEARDLARVLSGARDAQAARDALADLAKQDWQISARSLATLRARLEVIREHAEARILTEAMRQDLLAALDEATAAVERWGLDDLAFEAVAERLARSFRSARRALPDDWEQATPEELHTLRKRVVTHRYQMDLVAPLWPRFGRMWTGEAQRLRERLGKHQDLLVLARFTAPHQPLAHWRSRLLPAVEDRRRAHVTAARRLAIRFLAEKPGSLRRRLEAMWAATT
jgi:CHAD domain-containing protein